MAWLLLFLAGVLETGWTVGLKLSAGFTRPIASVLTIAMITASMFLLGLAVRTIPIGTAYPVWVGIGAFGAVVLGIVVFGEPATASRLFFLALLLVSIAGLKLSTH